MRHEKDIHDDLLIVQVEPPQQEHGGDYYYRTCSPGIAMAQEEGVYVINLTNIHRKREELLKVADVLVLKNICDPDMLPIIQDRKRQKRLTVYEIADDLGAIPPWNPVHFFYKNHENIILFKRLSQYCDAIQFSVDELKRLYGYLNPSAAVFLNQMSTIPPERAYKSRQKVVIGWGGSHGHLEDMADIVEPLTHWILSKPDVYLYLMCSDTIWNLFKHLPAERKRRFKTGPLKDYYDFLKNIDIGLAPLKDTAFNRSRSDIKFLEYAIHGVAPVVQHSAPYIDSARNGETGFLFKNSAELIDILNRLIENRQLMEKVARTARDYVIDKRLESNNVKKRIEFYKKNLSKLDDEKGSKSHIAKIHEEFSKLDGTMHQGRYLRLMRTQFENLLQDGLILNQIKHDPIRAHEFFSEASRLEPENCLPYLFGAHCSEDPIDSLKQATKRNPLSLKSYTLLGGEYAKRGNVLKAIGCFERAIEIFSDYEIPYLRAASILRAIGNHKASDNLLLKAKTLMIP